MHWNVTAHQLWVNDVVMDAWFFSFNFLHVSDFHIRTLITSIKQKHDTFFFSSFGI